MTDKPTDEALENLFVEETGFDIDDFLAAIFGFTRAALAKWGTPATGGEPAGTVGYTVHGTQYVNWRTKPPAHGAPLYTAPQPTQTQAVALPLTDEQTKALMQAHRTAMLMTCKARVPECGEFAAIAQDLDWLCESFGIKGGQHVS